MKHRFLVLSLAALVAVGLFALPLAAETGDFTVPDDALGDILSAKEEGVYIIYMTGDPVVAYEGDVNGFPATKPGNGQKINPNNGAVKKYVNYLKNQHNQAMQAAGADTKNIFYDYVYSFNGFAATLNAAEAAALANNPDVIWVREDPLHFTDTDNSSSFLGLDAPGGLWDQVGGIESAGEDVIIGVIDTGIWPEHPSFSDQADFADRPGESGKDQRVYGPAPASWHGTCQSGEQWSQDDCNNKLIGARYYTLGLNANGVIPTEYLSARDRDGHGTHTASTAGGNYGVPAEILGADYGTVSGMAPRARIAAYKACWNDAGCFGSDLTAAIDQAVADGVDVINYSIGSDTPGLLGSDDIAFLFAADAGVFVATSNGNAGPGAATTGSPASVPWVTAVGASTQNRTFEGEAVLGNGSSYFGASVTGGTDVLPLVDAADAGDALCHVGALDPNVVAGKIVLCRRGDIARVEKSHAVYVAGGAGMILYNTFDADTQVTDNHWVPSVHTNFTDGSAIAAYIDAEGANATAQIFGGQFATIPAPWMAAFSSRGPNGAAGDLIKPDVTAPGVNILAGNTPNPYLGAPGELFQAISGTSMSSPHVAGNAALLVQLHPDWSPAAIKSALMTTADPNVMKEDGATPADPFDMGAGHITPNSAADPGLVYDADFFDYLAFLCGSTNAVGPGTCGVLNSWGYSFDASDLNLASMGIDALAGEQTITRRVTNVGGSAATYNVAVNAPAGVSVSVSPASLTLNPGETKSFDVTFTVTGAATLYDWAFGDLTWSDGSHSVRSPMAVFPVQLANPLEVFGSGSSGSLNYDVTFGYAGDFAAEAHGLNAASTQAGNVVDDPANDINTALGSGVGITLHAVAVPAGTEYLRFSLFDDYTDGADDLDLYIFDPGFGFAGGSGSGTSAEEVNIVAPAAGTWYVVVHGWQTDGADSNYTLFSWAVGDAAAGNMTVSAPASAVLGASGAVTVNWSGLAADTKYLGAVTYHDTAAPAGWNDSLIDFTVVAVSTD